MRSREDIESDYEENAFESNDNAIIIELLLDIRDKLYEHHVS